MLDDINHVELIADLPKEAQGALTGVSTQFCEITDMEEREVELNIQKEVFEVLARVAIVMGAMTRGIQISDAYLKADGDICRIMSRSRYGRRHDTHYQLALIKIFRLHAERLLEDR